MRLIQLKFIRIGNHWYINLPHTDPRDLRMCEKIEKYFNKISRDSHVIDNIYLLETEETIIKDGLIDIKDTDLSRIFMSEDEFLMDISVGTHIITISSNLYSLMEERYKLDLHLNIYRLIIDTTRIY